MRGEGGPGAALLRGARLAAETFRWRKFVGFRDALEEEARPRGVRSCLGTGAFFLERSSSCSAAAGASVDCGAGCFQPAANGWLACHAGLPAMKLRLSKVRPTRVSSRPASRRLLYPGVC